MTTIKRVLSSISDWRSIVPRPVHNRPQNGSPCFGCAGKEASSDMKPWRGIMKLVGCGNDGKRPALPLKDRGMHKGPLRAARQPRALDCERRIEIIAAYAHVLEHCSSPVEPESALPYPKELIRQAIHDELTENPETEFRSHLEIAFVRLESFLPAVEYEVLSNFKMADMKAIEVAKSGTPRDIMASARILQEVKIDWAVSIQERISEEMQKRLEQIRATGTCTIPD